MERVEADRSNNNRLCSKSTDRFDSFKLEKNGEYSEWVYDEVRSTPNRVSVTGAVVTATPASENEVDRSLPSLDFSFFSMERTPEPFCYGVTAEISHCNEPMRLDLEECRMNG